jgi:CheY-like chemotaxis protein
LETLPNITGVVVADDDPIIRSILRAKFEAIGQTVFVVSDGLDAVEHASRIQASLILLDLNMPRLNGLLTCQRIRQLPNNAQTPIVILTGMREKDVEAAAIRVGATTFLTKPFRSAQLLQVAARFLPLTADMRQSIRRTADRAEKIANPNVGFDQHTIGDQWSRYSLR